MKETKATILYVDDEANNLLTFKANFRRFYEVYTAESAEEGRKLLQDKKFSIIITDQRMPAITGVQFLESIIKEFPDPIRILITGYSDLEVVIEAINKGQIYRYVMKPFNVDELKAVLDNAHEVYSLREENKELMKIALKANEQLEFMLRQRLISLDNSDANL